MHDYVDFQFQNCKEITKTFFLKEEKYK